MIKKQTASVLYLAAKESLAIAAFAALYPLGLAKEKPKRSPRQRYQQTVVLVHGYLANRSSLMPMLLYLKARGHKQIYTYEYKPSDTVENAGAGLKKFLRETVRGGRIDLVCHSMGGVIARYYLQEMRGFRRVDRCITLGTPHAGTYNAYWLPEHMSGPLRPNSELLQKLAASHGRAASVTFHSIVGESDNIVIPKQSCYFDQVTLLPDTGHVGMLFSHKAYKAVADALKEPLQPKAIGAVAAAR